MTIGSLDPDPESNQEASRLLRMLDKAIEFQRPMVYRQIQRARQGKPDASPADIIKTLERQYIAALSASGAAVGGTAAAPGVGTTVALALTLGEMTTSLELSVVLALTMAEIHGVGIEEVERRRTLVLLILLGNSGPATIKKVAARTGKHWGRYMTNAVPLEGIRQINKVLGRNFVTRYGTRQGIVVLGRVAPFGVGVVIGGAGNALLARGVVQGARLAFGPAPTAWRVGLAAV